jgi:hypothetical protein
MIMFWYKKWETEPFSDLIPTPALHHVLPALPCAHADLVAAAVDPLRQPVVEVAYKRNGSFFSFPMLVPSLSW